MTSHCLCVADIDECINKTINDCDTIHGSCKNTMGSYACTCNSGFTGDGLTCSGKCLH